MFNIVPSPQEDIPIPESSNIKFLPLMYFLPENIIEMCPTLRRLPRDIHEIIGNTEMIATVESNQFLHEIMDAFAYLVFPHFGIRGWKEDYSGYCPIWQLSYLLNVWLDCLIILYGWSLRSLSRVTSVFGIPFIKPEYFYDYIHRVVRLGIERHNLQPIIDAVRKMPCEEDFEIWQSRVKIDFYRKWYHTRTMVGTMMSLDECTQGSDEDYYSTIAADPRDMTESVALEDFYERFKNQLTDRDREILELRMDGMNFEGIAERLGYKNHSGVVKRMQAIKKEFLKYQSV